MALRLRADVLDSTVRLNSRLQYMQAWASLHGHPQAKLEDAGDALKTMYFDALHEIPYLTGGKSGDEMGNEERMAAVDRYKQYKDNVLKPGTVSQPPLARPVPAHKHKAVPA